MESITQRLTAAAIDEIRSEIVSVGGNEICIVGRCDEDGRVADVVVTARGHASAVPVVAGYVEHGDVILHNHPTGKLHPSDADIEVASRFAQDGIGFYIVDNDLTDLYAVTEPVLGKTIRPIDIDHIETLLVPGGKFSQIFPEYEPRSQQIEMMQRVAEGFNDGRLVVAEAGTGVGKSIAYLVPALIWAEQNEERIVISTATINLQQQLLDNDIPLAKRITDLDTKAVLVKGRGNYVCLRRLQDAAQEGLLFDQDRDEIELVSQWVTTTDTGSRSDLPSYISNESWAKVCSESDSCRGLRCAQRGDCFVLRARKETASARILITNHHLLFSDLAIRRGGMGKDGTAVLPPYHHIVFDEAHNIERNATSFFSERFGRAGLTRNLSQLHRPGKGSNGGLLTRLSGYLSLSDVSTVPDNIGRIEITRRYADELNDFLATAFEGRTLRFAGNSDQTRIGEIRERIANLHVPLVRVVGGISEAIRNIPDEYAEDDVVIDVQVIVRRLEQYAAVMDRFLNFEEYPGEVFWIEKRTIPKGEASATMNITPVDVSEIMNELVYSTYDTVVCTSATLTVQNRFDYFAQRMGFPNGEDSAAHFLHVDSPFAYRDRVLLAASGDAPDPSDPSFQDFVSRAVRDLLELTEGRGLILFTSYAMLARTFDVVAPVLEANGIMALRHGSDDRSSLLRKFTDEPSSVLFATDSFWEGVDAPGDALRIVIICRLPFRVPNDPVFEARVEAIERGGGNSFYELSVPQAIMKLKQGFGRLMRRATDRGVVVVLDPRIVTRQYGRLFVESLPETSVSFTAFAHMLNDVERFLYQ